MKEIKEKPKAIVLDCDDVIVDFMGFLVLIHNKKYKTHITRQDVVGYPLQGEEVENIFGTVVADVNLEDTFKELEPHGLYTMLPVFAESKQAIIYAQDLGYKIIIMTARPIQFKEQTELSLLVNDIPYDELLFAYNKADKINQLKDKYDIVLFADDRAKTIKAVNNQCNIKYPILVNQPHNEHSKLSQKIIRVNDLLEVIKYLKEEGQDENE